MSMLFETPDPNERFRARRAAVRRARRRRRLVAAAVLLTIVLVLAVGWRLSSGDPTAAGKRGASPVGERATQARAPAPPAVTPVPAEIRGVHVTIALASLAGKLEEYLALRAHGLNTIELDVKDENGEIGFVPSAVPLARAIGAAKPYYRPREVARRAERAGVYLIGRVVVFEDPRLATSRPDLAVQNPDGSPWRNDAGLAWANPYDRRVWDYNVAIAEVAARAGFDEIQFDYVRFPTDGDLDRAVYPRRTKTPPPWVIAQFLHYASTRLQPLGVRVGVDVFGLSATRDLGIGQLPRRIARFVDAIYPMTYPSHYGRGEYGLDDPNAQPGETVFRALADFRRELRRGGADPDLVPWLQDFSLGSTYGLADVRAQIDAARAQGADGYLLWNPSGVYTEGALAPPSP